ncbi:hypothetical protein OBBRIDRAFT_812793 [Obba rivulosa]|uniref:Protein N-terminal glutamine amidohydrolase n=1 Tax=Obba rivulosa TaxID=1052685 RepID=A0A8E2AYA6_9APHY|nr:hypothetical protein OBBRIDRAFT_812793 [Obba rivulosa]
MSQPSLTSFDPLATHPFTNNSGLLPKPTAPSRFPRPIPPAAKTVHADPSRAPAPRTAAPIQSPAPKRGAPSAKPGSSAAKPIFTPFRPERSSPDLDDILLKKRVSDVLLNKKTWSIDQQPLASAVTAGSGRGGKLLCYCEENVYLLTQTFQRLAAERESWPWNAYAVFISNETRTVALWSQKAQRDIVVWDYHVILILQPREPCRHRNEASEDGAWVYDFDTRLPNPCRWIDYMYGTFPYAFDGRLAAQVPQQFHSLFRIVPEEIFLAHFASDRSHMVRPPPIALHSLLLRYQLTRTSAPSSCAQAILGWIQEGGRAELQVRYTAPPPAYPPLCGARARERGVTHNLMDAFVAMSLTAPSACACPEGPGAQVTESPEVTLGRVVDMAGFLDWVSGEERLHATYSQSASVPKVDALSSLKEIVSS